MKSFRVSLWLLLIVFVLVALATPARPVHVALPTVSAMYMPGAVRPSTLYCVIYVPPNIGYKYCEMRDNVYIVLKDDRIYRVYQFLPFDNPLTAGELVLLWGAPQQAYYSIDRTVLIWPDRFAGIGSRNTLSPSNRGGFIGYGICLYAGTVWRGWKASP